MIGVGPRVARGVEMGQSVHSPVPAKKEGPAARTGEGPPVSKKSRQGRRRQRLGRPFVT
jgi:hypothetical protein